VQRRITVGIHRLILLSYGGGVLSNHSTGTSERKYLASPPEHLESLWVDLSTSKACKECKDSPFIVRMVIPIAYRKPTLASIKVRIISICYLCDISSTIYLLSVVDLPQYSSYEKLRAQLLTAISEGGEGFGFA
jgi:hypothetical protein